MTAALIDDAKKCINSNESIQGLDSNLQASATWLYPTLPAITGHGLLLELVKKPLWAQWAFTQVGKLVYQTSRHERYITCFITSHIHSDDSGQPALSISASNLGGILGVSSIPVAKGTLGKVQSCPQSPDSFASNSRRMHTVGSLLSGAARLASGDSIGARAMNILHPCGVQWRSVRF